MYNPNAYAYFAFLFVFVSCAYYENNLIIVPIQIIFSIVCFLVTSTINFLFTILIVLVSSIIIFTIPAGLYYLYMTKPSKEDFDIFIKEMINAETKKIKETVQSKPEPETDSNIPLWKKCTNNFKESVSSVVYRKSMETLLKSMMTVQCAEDHVFFTILTVAEKENTKHTFIGLARTWFPWK